MFQDKETHPPTRKAHVDRGRWNCGVLRSNELCSTARRAGFRLVIGTLAAAGVTKRPDTWVTARGRPRNLKRLRFAVGAVGGRVGYI